MLARPAPVERIGVYQYPPTESMTPAHELAADLKGPLVEMTCELVRIPSVSDHRGGDELRVQRRMAEWFGSAGARVRTFEARDVPEFFSHPLCYAPSRKYDDRPTVLAEIGPQDAPALLVLAHSDTVPLFEPEKWTVDPFGGEVRGGRIYGLGCSDDKWGLAAMVTILRALQPFESSLRKRVIFASTVDEESGVGNGTLLLHLAGVRAEAALYLDGYRMEIFIGCLGGSHLELRPKRAMPKDVLDRCHDDLAVACRRLALARAPLFDRPMFADNAWRERTVGVFRRSDASGDYLLVPFYTLPGESNDAVLREVDATVWGGLGDSAADLFDITCKPTWFEPAVVPPGTALVEHMRASARQALGVEPVVTTICKQDSFVLTN